MNELKESISFGVFVTILLTSLLFFVLKLFEPAIYLLLLAILIELMIISWNTDI